MVIKNDLSMDEVADIVYDKKYVSLDIETSGLDPFNDSIEWISLGWFNPKVEDGVVGTSFRFFADSKYSLVNFQRKFRDRFCYRHDDNYVIMHDGFFDLGFLKVNNFPVKNKLIDTLIASWMLDQLRDHSLKTLVREKFGFPMKDFAEVGDTDQHTMFRDNVDKYSANDSKWCLKLFEDQYPRLKKEELVQSFHEIYMELIPILVDMKLKGVRVDVDVLEDIEDNVDDYVEDLEEKIQKEAGCEFNPSSKKQLREVLFGERGNININPEDHNIKEIQSGYSTAEAELNKLSRAGYDIADLILNYRGKKKLKTTYTSSIKEHLKRSPDNRLHGDTKAGKTKTGRLSSANPNLQNIPSGQKDDDLKIRKAFKAEKDKKLIVSDYCVYENSKILTTNGLKKIKDIDIDRDKVLLDDQRISDINAKIEKGKEDVYKVKTKMGYQLIGTEIHRIKALAEDDTSDDWYEINELSEGDHVLLSAQEYFPDSNPEMPKLDYDAYFNEKEISIPNRMNDDLAFFFGYIIGDGSIENRSIKWVVNKNDDGLVDKINNICQDQFNVNPSDKGERRGVYTYLIHRRKLVEYIKDIGLSKESIPELIFSSKKSTIASFLSGLFEADGSIQTGRSEGAQISLDMASGEVVKDIQDILLQFGILSKYGIINKEEYKDLHYVNIPSHFSDKFISEIGFTSERKSSKLDKYSKNINDESRSKCVYYGNYPSEIFQNLNYSDIRGKSYDSLKNTVGRDTDVSPTTIERIVNNDREFAEEIGIFDYYKNNIYFDEIESIEYMGEKNVYDLSIDKKQLYISNGFNSHNSQMELRLMAHYSQDPKLLKIYQDGIDIHKVTAENLDVGRDVGKTVNYEVIYKIGPSTLAEELKDHGIQTTEDEAETYINEWFNTYSKTKKYYSNIRKQLVEQGYIYTLLGRKRYFNDEITWDNVYRYQRFGANSQIQGCIPGNARVLIKGRGYIPISEIEGENVEIWDGEKFVSAECVYSGKKDRTKIEFSDHSFYESSPDHEYKCLTDSFNSNFKRAENLRPYSESTTPEKVLYNQKLPDFNNEIHFEEYGSKSHKKAPNGVGNYKNYSLNQFDNMDNLGIFLGRIASDGDVRSYFDKNDKSEVRLIFDEKESDLIDKFVDIFDRLDWNYTINDKKREDRNNIIYTVHIYSVNLVRQLKNIKIKEYLPEQCWKNKDLLASYLSGIFDGDGGISADKIDINFGDQNYKIERMRQIQEALRLFGIRSRFYHYEGDRVRVSISKKYIDTFQEKIGFISERKINLLEDKVNLIDFSDYETPYLSTLNVKDKEITGDKIDMYDIMNSDSGQFMSGGLILHNSGADVINCSTITLAEELQNIDGSNIILSIHDELVVEAPEDKVDKTKELTEHHMENQVDISVPLPVETAVVDNWGEAK